MVVAEALARGIPVVSTMTGAIPDLVGADAGLLVPVGDEDALTAALRSVIDDAPLRAAPGGRATGTRAAAHVGQFGRHLAEALDRLRTARPHHMEAFSAEWLALREAGGPRRPRHATGHAGRGRAGRVRAARRDRGRSRGRHGIEPALPGAAAAVRSAMDAPGSRPAAAGQGHPRLGWPATPRRTVSPSTRRASIWRRWDYPCSRTRPDAPRRRRCWSRRRRCSI